MSMNSYVSGVQNEVDFTEYLNNKEYHELESNASKFIKQIYGHKNEAYNVSVVL